MCHALVSQETGELRWLWKRHCSMFLNVNFSKQRKWEYILCELIVDALRFCGPLLPLPCSVPMEKILLPRWFGNKRLHRMRVHEVTFKAEIVCEMLQPGMHNKSVLMKMTYGRREGHYKRK